jgi:hypothetical protein
MFGPLLPEAGTKFLNLVDQAVATVMAAKSMTKPCGHEIRVVHVPTGEVVFRKTKDCASCAGDDL